MRNSFRSGYSHHFVLVTSLPTWAPDGFGEFRSSLSRPCLPVPQSWVAVTWQSSPRGTISPSCAEQLGSAGRQDLSLTLSLLLLSRLKMSFSFSGCTELRMMMPSPRSRHSSPAMHRDTQGHHCRSPAGSQLHPAAHQEHVPSPSSSGKSVDFSFPTLILAPLWAPQYKREVDELG